MSSSKCKEEILASLQAQINSIESEASDLENEDCTECQICIDSPEKAFQKIQQLVAVRDRSVHEIKQRLSSLNYSQQAISIAVERALSCNYLNDERFTEVYLRSKVNRNKGLRGAKADLLAQGISESFIDECIEAFFDMDQEELRAYQLLCQKPPRSKNKFQAAYGKLIRNGYQSSVALSATKRWISSISLKN